VGQNERLKVAICKGSGICPKNFLIEFFSEFFVDIAWLFDSLLMLCGIGANE
jgi:hypothetical protein